MLLNSSSSLKSTCKLLQLVKQEKAFTLQAFIFKPSGLTCFLFCSKHLVGVSQVFSPQMEVMKPAPKASQHTFQDLGIILFALSGRSLHHAMRDPIKGGKAIAAVLRHIYFKESLELCIANYELDLRGVDSEENKTLWKATAIAVKLVGNLDISDDYVEAQQQVIQHVGQALQQQADGCACGLPTTALAHVLLELLALSPDTVAAAAPGGGCDLLGKQAELLTPAFKRISAGKAFGQCPIHKDKACSISAQMSLTRTFCQLATDSSTTQAGMWRSGMFAFCHRDQSVAPNSLYRQCVYGKLWQGAKPGFPAKLAVIC